MAPIDRSRDKFLSSLTERLVGTYEECGRIHHLGHTPLPSYAEIVEILIDLR